MQQNIAKQNKTRHTKTEKTYFVYNKWCTFIPKCSHEDQRWHWGKVRNGWRRIKLRWNKLPGKCLSNTQNKPTEIFSQQSVENAWILFSWNDWCDCEILHLDLSRCWSLHEKMSSRYYIQTVSVVIFIVLVCFCDTGIWWITLCSNCCCIVCNTV